MLTPINVLLGLIMLLALLMVTVAIVGLVTRTIDPAIVFGGCATVISGCVGVVAIRIAVETRKDKDR